MSKTQTYRKLVRYKLLTFFFHSSHCVSQGQLLYKTAKQAKGVFHYTKLQFMSVLRTDDIDPEMDRF